MKELISLEEKLNRISRAVKPDEVFSERLWNEIENSNQTEKRPNIIRLLVKRPALSFASMLLAGLLLFTAIQPQLILAAFRELFDYLPGIGFIEDTDTAKSIAEPIEFYKDGVTIVVDQAVADTNKTIVTYELTSDAAIAETFNECFYSKNILQLSDGRSLLPIGGGVSNHSAHIEFMALPEGETAPVLEISRDNLGEHCGGPMVISVELPFTADISAEELSRVFESDEIGVDVKESSNIVNSAQTAGDQENPNHIVFQIDRLVDLENEYVIFGHIEWENSDIANVFLDYKSMHVEDAEGTNIPVLPSDEQNSDSEFSVKIGKGKWASPLTLYADKVQIMYRPENVPEFSVDTSSIPEIGQSMEIDQQFELAGKLFSFEKITYMQYENSEHTGYAFDIRIDPDIHSINLGIGEDYGNMDYFGSVMPIDEKHIRTTIGSPQSFSDKEIPFTIYEIMYFDSGNWQAQWNIPE